MNNNEKPEIVSSIEQMGYSLEVKNSQNNFLRIYVLDEQGLRVGSVFTPSAIGSTYRKVSDITDRINGTVKFSNSRIDDALQERLKEARSIALVDIYENEKMSNKKIYEIAKTFDERSIFYLEDKLRESKIDLNDFQQKIRPKANKLTP